MSYTNDTYSDDQIAEFDTTGFVSNIENEFGNIAPEKVCICENPYAQHSLRYHQDDCPFFEDYSNSESGYVY